MQKQMIAITRSIYQISVISAIEEKPHAMLSIVRHFSLVQKRPIDGAKRVKFLNNNNIDRHYSFH